jgi:hypothetical protein
MSTWLAAHYDVIKDFAAPIVAFIAAIIAGLITLTLSRAQTHIARSQRDIALDRLKFDLFEKRYTIYAAAKSLVTYIAANASEHGKYNFDTVRSFYVTLEEARFYFPREQRAVFKHLHEAAETYFNHLAQRALINIDDAEKWRSTADQLANDLRVLMEIFESLPEKFESALGFKQLTDPQ